MRLAVLTKADRWRTRLVTLSLLAEIRDLEEKVAEAAGFSEDCRRVREGERE